jgi:ADP-ribose pyrophosphatase
MAQEPSDLDAHLRESRVGDTDRVFSGHFLQVDRDTARLPDGSQAVREYVRHPGAAMIVPLLDNGNLVMERQFRFPVSRVMLEFPAGKLDAGESSLVCAQRELWEETGYRAREWALAGRVHPVIAYSTEFIDIWFARGLRAGERRLDAGEFLDVIAVEPAQLMQWSAQGQVTDAKTLAGLLWLQNIQSGQWTLDWQTPEPGELPV